MGKGLGALYGSIGVDTTRWDRAMAKMRTDLGQVATAGQAAAAKVSRNFQQAGSKVTSVGKNMTMAMSAPIALLGGAAVKAAADFEEAMVEVEKVTNPKTAQLMTARIRTMAETIPLAQSELADLTAQAARFGVRGVDNLTSFTTAVSKMAIATDLSAEEAGTALAKIGTLTKIPATKVENLGSAVNELANNFATSSSEIVGSMLRAGAAGSQFGLSAQEMSGLSAALNAVSESSERAGSRLRRLFQELMDPKSVGKIAGAIGMTTDEFSRMSKETPLAAIQKLIGSMKAGGQEAQNLRSVLTTTSLQALSGLAQNADGVTTAVNMAGDAFKENTSLQKEFEAATSTFNSKLAILWNRVRDVGISIGNILLPPLLQVISQAQVFVEYLRGLNKETLVFATKIAGIVAVLGPMVTGLGFVITGIGKLAGAFSVMISAAKVAAGFLLGLSWPVVLGVAAIAAAATAIIANWDRIVAFFTTGRGGVVWQMLKTSVTSAMQALAPIVNSAINSVKEAWSGVVAYFSEGEGVAFLSALKGAFISVFDAIVNTIKMHVMLIKEAWKVVGPYIVGAFSGLWDRVKIILSTAFNGIISVFKMLFEQVINIFDVFEGLFTGNWGKMWNAIKNIWVTSVNGLIEILSGLVTGSIDLINSFLSQLGVGEELQETLSGASESLAKLAKDAKMTKFSIDGAEKSTSAWGSMWDVLGEKAQEAGIKMNNAASSATPTKSSGGGEEGGNNPSISKVDPPSLSSLLDISSDSEAFQAHLDKMSQKTRDFGANAQSGFNRAKQGAIIMGQAMQGTVSNAITGFAETLGNALAGKAGAGSFFDAILMMVLDFTSKFGKMLVSAGIAAIAFQNLLLNPYAAVAIGATLIAASAAIKGLLSKGPGKGGGGGKGEEGSGNGPRTTSVNDALITSNGQVIKLAPNDDVLAMPGLGDMTGSKAVTGGRGAGDTIMNIMSLDGDVVWKNQKRVNHKRKR